MRYGTASGLLVIVGIVMVSILNAGMVAASSPGPTAACMVIDTAGEYDVTTDLVAVGTCFRVNVSDVIIDGSNFGIAGDGTGDGISADASTNITIKNFRYITGCIDGVRFIVNGSAIMDVNASSNSGDGIYVEGGNDTITDSVAAGNGGNGVHLDVHSSGDAMVNVTADLNGHRGIVLQGASHNSIFNGTASSNQGNGIDLYYDYVFDKTSDYNTISGTIVDGNHQDGVYFDEASHNVLSSVTASMNNNIGFDLYPDTTGRSVGNAITGCVADGDRGGVYLQNATNTYIAGVRIDGSVLDAILLSQNCVDNTFVDVNVTDTNPSYSDILDDGGNVGTTFIDCGLARYSFMSPGSTVNFRTTDGDINYTSPIIQTGAHLAADVRLAHNLAFVNSAKTGLNRSALVTLRDLPTDLASASILRDGVLCPPDVCTALTALNAGNVSFSVTGWSNYSISGTSCSDGIKNGAETDIDCGGGACSPCSNGLSCVDNNDCDSGMCTGGACVAGVAVPEFGTGALVAALAITAIALLAMRRT